MNIDAELPHLPEAACRNHPEPDAFFPSWDTGRPSKHARQLALLEVKAYCDICPERLKCLKWALDHGEQGVWGGTTDEQRRLMQKKPLTQEQRRRRVRQMHREGLTDGVIANDLKVSRSVVQDDRHALGLPSNYNADQAVAITDRRKRVANLHRAGFNDVEMGRRLGCTRDAVRRDRLALGLAENYRAGKGETA